MAMVLRARVPSVATARQAELLATGESYILHFIPGRTSPRTARPPARPPAHALARLKLAWSLGTPRVRVHVLRFQ